MGGNPAPAGKAVDFTAARDGTAKSKPPEKTVPDKDDQAGKLPDGSKPHGQGEQ